MLTSLIIGIIAGSLAGKIMDVKKGSFLRTIIIGIIGSFVGSGLMSIIGFSAHGFIANILESVLGACVFLFIAKRILK